MTFKALTSFSLVSLQVRLLSLVRSNTQRWNECEFCFYKEETLDVESKDRISCLYFFMLIFLPVIINGLKNIDGDMSRLKRVGIV